MTTTTIPRRALILLAILTLVWGTNWPLFTMVLQEVSVWHFRLVSVLISGTVLLSFAKVQGDSLVVPRAHWPTLILAALAYLTVWNVASAVACVLIPSGQAAILGFTMPLWVALISWLLLHERFSPRLLIALALGATAVVLLMIPSFKSYQQAPLGMGLGLLSGIGWAIGTLILKRKPIPIPTAVLTGWQLYIAAVPIGLGGVLFGGEWVIPSTKVMWFILYIALGPMSIGNLCWFSIVKLLPANVAGLSSIMVPIVAMIAGAVVHREPLGLLQWLAMACCVAALWLVLNKPKAA
jgi:drug/metabolite transporter (DMT)-like permease